MKTLRSILCATLLLAGLPCSAELTAAVNSTALTELETLQLALNWTGAEPAGQPDFAPLTADFEILGSPQTSTQVSVTTVGGVTESRSSKSWILSLRPKRMGRLLIPAITFNNHRTQPIEITVNKLSTQAQARMSELAFVLTSVDRQSAYVQGQVIYTIKFYSRYSYNGNLPQDPVLDNALVKKLGESDTHQTTLSTGTYITKEWQYAIFPQKSGVLEIPPIILDGKVISREGGIWTRERSEQVRLTSSGHRLPILPVPAAFTGSSWLPALSLELHEEWSGKPPSLTVGVPINRTITLTAEGVPLSLLEPFVSMVIDGAKVYTDPPRTNETLSAKGVLTTRSDTYGILPTRAGRLTLPEISVHWWNTRSNRMEVARIPAASFMVSPAPQSDRASPQAGMAAPTPTTMQAAPDAVAPLSHWSYIAALLALGWALTTILWLHTRIALGRATKPADSISSAARSDLADAGAAFAQLRIHCGNNDPVAARATLLQWARALCPEQKLRNLEDLQRHFPACQLGQILAELDRTLYSQGKGEQWQGEALLAEATRIGSMVGESHHGAQSPIVELNPT